jgi:class 3 adenylate cyclase
MDPADVALEREREALRDWLEAHGASPEQAEAGAGAASRIGDASGVAADLVLGRGVTLTARQLADRAGVRLDQLLGGWRDLGIAVADVDRPQFTEADARAAVGRLQAMAEGLDTLSELNQVVAGALERIAEAAVALYVQGPEEDLRRGGASLVEHAEKTTKAVELALVLGVTLAPIFRHHMRQAIERSRVTRSGVSRTELARLAIGFVDLVGSTSVQARLDPAELREMVTRFESRAFEITAAGGGRLVKFIGDEIMVAAVDPVAGCRIVLDLVEAFADDGGRQPRGGLVFGEVLFRHGDYYGPVVNLAARLVDTAIPGEVLVDASVVDEAKDEDLSFEPAGRRLLHGFDHPVVVWSLAAT